VSSRAAQLCSVLVLGTTTAVLAWSGTAADPSPVAGPVVLPAAPAAPSAAASAAGAAGAAGATGPVVGADGPDGSRTAARRATTPDRTGLGHPDGPAVPAPPAAVAPAAATPAAVAPAAVAPATPADGAPGTMSEVAGNAVEPVGAVEPAEPVGGTGDGTSGPDGVPASPAPTPATDPTDPAEADHADHPDDVGGSPTAGPLAGRSLAEVLGPEGAPAPAPAPLRPPAPAGLDLARWSTQDPSSTWVVVNKARPLVPADHVPADLTTVQGYEVRAQVRGPLTDMLAAAAADGVQLGLRSAYRSAAYQQAVHGSWARLVGEARADEVSARAGHSEHQTGLAVDVGSTTRPECDFQDCFDTTVEGAWVAEHAGEFGFLVRYTAATQEVTGFAPEGWHLRYVGTELVTELERRGLATLEELFGLPGGPGYS